MDFATPECRVFTFKEGLLSKIAHDLEIEVTDLKVELDGEKLSAVVDAKSLRVVGAHTNGRLDPGVLSAGDRAKIEKSIVKDVLHSAKHPEIRFEGTVEQGETQATIKGTLHLHGRSKPITATATLVDGVWSSELQIHQPDFGIKPYSAMLGALKVKPEVRVKVTLGPR